MTRALLLLALLLSGCSSADVSDTAFRVLYVGNSLTYVNDLPAVVGELAATEGTEYAFEMVAAANVSLEDHWNAGVALDRLRRERFDVMVMQQGPSTLASSQENLREWVGNFAQAARAEGTAPAVYMVWPPVGTPIERSEISYANAAADANATLLPAGRAWRIALAADPNVGVYGPDQFHPSPTGTLLAALAVYGGLFGDLPDSLPASISVGGSVLRLTPAQARTLLDAAQVALDANS